MSNKNELMQVFKVGDSEIKLSPSIISEYIIGNKNVNISNQEFKMFVELCKVRQLNPFLKEAYLIKYSNTTPAVMVVGKDAILKRAIMHPDFNGREQGIIVENKKGEVEYRKGTFMLKGEELLGGWAKVYRKNLDVPTEITVSFDEVAQRKSNGELNSAWATKGATMVEKVALVRALRETFTEDLGGMIDEDEAWSNKDLGKQVSGMEKHNREPEEVEVVVENTIIDMDEI